MSNRNEIEWIEYIRRMFPGPGLDENRFIGDDAAVVSMQDAGECVISTDMLVENIHFTRENFRFEEIAQRALAANLSDIAAMGGIPKYILLSLGLPDTVSDGDIEPFFRGLKNGCDAYGVQLIGGDLNRSPDTIIVSITILGFPCGGPFLTRAGARAGDLLFVTGTLGDSRLGLHCLRHKSGQDYRAGTDQTLRNLIEVVVMRHKIPVPRVSEGILLSTQNLATSLIDISDGLATDLGRLAKAGSVGCEVRVNQLPVSDEVMNVAPIYQLDPVELAVSGGEDFELLFTAHPDKENEIMNRFKGLGTRVTRIGRITGPETGILYYDKNNELMDVQTENLHF